MKTTSTYPQERIYATVVTFNPDLKRLRDNLRAVSGQAAGVFVVDNGSRDVRAVRFLVSEFPSCMLVENGQNLGVAAALNRGVRAARDAGAVAVLLLDEDSTSAPGMVQTLARHLDEDVGLVCPLIGNYLEGDALETSDAVCQVSRAINSGSLVSVAAYEAVGGFDEMLFVDWVDMDFCANLRLHGFRILQTHEVALAHAIGDNQYARKVPWFSRERGFHLKQMYRTNHSDFRREDKARSWAIVLRKYRGTQEYAVERSCIVKEFVSNLLFERRRCALLRAFRRGWRRGVEACARNGIK
ncbi:MAG: glycosyltransferase [Eggerthellaceae bacterium]|nr:glycosyltransferase [Eggerthellaceae bacterium]